MPPALEGEVLTTGPPGRFPLQLFLMVQKFSFYAWLPLGITQNVWNPSAAHPWCQLNKISGWQHECVIQVLWESKNWVTEGSRGLSTKFTFSVCLALRMILCTRSSETMCRGAPTPTFLPLRPWAFRADSPPWSEAIAGTVCLCLCLLWLVLFVSWLRNLC